MLPSPVLAAESLTLFRHVETADRVERRGAVRPSLLLLARASDESCDSITFGVDGGSGVADAQRPESRLWPGICK